MPSNLAHGCACVLLVGLAATRAVGGRAAPIDVQVREGPDRIVVTAAATIDADVATTWEVLTDYARYPDFVPGIRSARVVRREGARVTVEQSGTAFLGFAQLPFSAVYEIAERPTGELWSSAAIDGAGRLDSHYVLRPMGAQTELRYEGSLAVRHAAARPIEGAVARQTIARQFQALANRIERARALPGRAVAMPHDGDDVRRDASPGSADAASGVR